MLRSVATLLVATALGTYLIAAQPARADPITFQCSFSDGTPCTPVPGLPNTWTNPVIGENEPVSERSMTIQILGARFLAVPQVFNIFELDGSISDQVLVINDNNRSTIVFLSDPLVPIPLPSATDLGTETDIGISADFIAAISDGVSDFLVLVSIFSDGEFFFDPFGIGVDSSDGIQVQLLAPNRPVGPYSF